MCIRKSTYSLLLVVLVAVFFACGPAEPDSTHDEIAKRLREKLPPDPSVAHLSLQALEEERPVLVVLQDFLRESRGKRKIIEIGGTWCLPCIERYPDFVEVARENSDLEFALLASERDLDHEGVLDTLMLAWHGSGGVGFPAFLVLDGADKQIGDHLYEMLPSALDAARGGGSAGGEQSCFGRMDEILAPFGDKVVMINSTEAAQEDKGLETLPEYADSLERQLGIEVYVPPSLSERQVFLSVEAQGPAVLQMLCEFAECEMKVLGLGEGDPPLVLLLPAVKPGELALGPSS